MAEIKKIDKVHKWTKEIDSPSQGPAQKQTREEKTGLFVGYRDAFFMPIKAPRDANPRKTIREIRKNSYTERGRPVEIHRFLTRAKELFLGNLDNL